MKDIWVLTVDGFSYTGAFKNGEHEVHDLFLYEDEEIARNEFIFVADMMPGVYLPDSDDDDDNLLEGVYSPFVVVDTDELLVLDELFPEEGMPSQYLRIQLRKSTVLNEGEYARRGRAYVERLESFRT